MMRIPSFLFRVSWIYVSNINFLFSLFLFLGEFLIYFEAAFFIFFFIIKFSLFNRIIFLGCPSYFLILMSFLVVLQFWIFLLKFLHKNFGTYRLPLKKLERKNFHKYFVNFLLTLTHNKLKKLNTTLTS